MGKKKVRSRRTRSRKVRRSIKTRRNRMRGGSSTFNPFATAEERAAAAAPAAAVQAAGGSTFEPFATAEERAAAAVPVLAPPPAVQAAGGSTFEPFATAEERAAAAAAAAIRHQHSNFDFLIEELGAAKTNADEKKILRACWNLIVEIGRYSQNLADECEKEYDEAVKINMFKLYFNDLSNVPDKAAKILN